MVSNGSSARVIGNVIQSNMGAGVLVTRESLADSACRMTPRRWRGTLPPRLSMRATSSWPV